MAKTGKRKATDVGAEEDAKVKRRRGNRKGMVLELEPGDQELLDDLVERYRKPLGGDSNKARVLRQLIRHAASQKTLPPLIG